MAQAAAAPTLLTVDEAADLVRVSACSVYRKLESGEWGGDIAFKVGPQWRIDQDALLASLRTRPERDPPPAKPLSAQDRFAELMAEQGESLQKGRR